MNRDKLLGVLMLNGERLEDLAKLLDRDRATVSRKLNGYQGAEFTQGEIKVIRDKYKLSPKQVDEIFFAQGVS